MRKSSVSHPFFSPTSAACLSQRGPGRRADRQEPALGGDQYIVGVGSAGGRLNIEDCSEPKALKCD